MPHISVCIPTYNGAAYIGQTIQSVLDQTFADFEILIFDDNSTDNTAEIVKSFTDPRIHYVRNKQNLGPKGNWDHCLKQAKGTYYKLLPHDDILYPDCLASQSEVLDNDMDKSIALVFSQRDIINMDGDVLMSRRSFGITSRRINAQTLINQCIRTGGNIIGEPGNGLFRRELIEQIGLYDDTHPYTIDLDYWFRVLAHGDGYYLARKGSAFRIHPEAWTSEIGEKQHQDYIGTINKFYAERAYNVSQMTRAIGTWRAKINTPIRRLIYRLKS